MTQRRASVLAWSGSRSPRVFARRAVDRRRRHRLARRSSRRRGAPERGVAVSVLDVRGSWSSRRGPSSRRTSRATRSAGCCRASRPRHVDRLGEAVYFHAPPCAGTSRGPAPSSACGSRTRCGSGGPARARGAAAPVPDRQAADAARRICRLGRRGRRRPSVRRIFLAVLAGRLPTGVYIRGRGVDAGLRELGRVRTVVGDHDRRRRLDRRVLPSLARHRARAAEVVHRRRGPPRGGLRGRSRALAWADRRREHGLSRWACSGSRWRWRWRSSATVPTSTLAPVYGADLALVLLTGLAVGRSGFAVALPTLAVRRASGPARGAHPGRGRPPLLPPQVRRSSSRSRRSPARLRDEVAARRARLPSCAGVVTSTMQPAHLSLWLRAGADR